MAISFFSSSFRLSRISLVFYLVISLILIVFVKLYFRKLIFKLPIKLVFVGRGESIKKYYEIIKNYPNYHIMNWFDSPEGIEEETASEEFNPSTLEKDQCDGVVIGFSTNEANLAQNYIAKISHYLIPIMILPDVEYAKVGFRLKNFRGIPVLSINEPNAKSLGLFFKRIFDFVACSVGMILI